MTRGRGGWLHLSPYGSFIRYSMSVYPDAFGPSHSYTRSTELGTGVERGEVQVRVPAHSASIL